MARYVPPVHAVPSAPSDPAASEAPAPAPTKLPAPKRKPRHNEWTRQKMVAFLRELAASQSVSHAARSVGMSRNSAYRLRTRLQGTPFSLAWEVALEAGLQQLAHAVLDRALNGEEVPHYFRGELVGTYRKFDNRLAAWLLDNPWKVGRQQIAREYASEAFDRLLERIECASLDWEDGEHPPGRIVAVPPPDPYDEDYVEEEEQEPDAENEIAEYDEGHFVGSRSWYAAEAAANARGARGGRRYG